MIRWFREIGIIRGIFVLFAVLPVGSFLLFRGMGFSPCNYVLPLGGIIVVWLLHRTRKDYTFLFHIVRYPKWVSFTEYLVLTLLIPIALLYWKEGWLAGGYIFLLAGVASLPVRPSRLFVYRKLTAFIPADLFEWKSGVRRHMGELGIAILLGVAGIYSFGLSMAAFFLFVSIFLMFYVENEPLNLLLVKEDDPGSFLRRKLFLHLCCPAIFLLPFLGIALLHFSYVIYSLLAYVAVLNLLGFAVLLKYAYYRPATYVASRCWILTVVCIGSVLLPLMIGVFLLNLLLYRKAFKNLAGYFYAGY